MTVDSIQNLDADVYAVATAQIGQATGDVDLRATAYGQGLTTAVNAADAFVEVSQTAEPDSFVEAEARLTLGQGDELVDAQALAAHNALEMNAFDGELTSLVAQTGGQFTEAVAVIEGGDLGPDVFAQAGATVNSVLAVQGAGNNIAEIGQTAGGDRTGATADIIAAAAELAATAADAASNSASLINNGGYAELNVSQDNFAQVQAATLVDLGTFQTVELDAGGVGNTAELLNASNSDTVLIANQFNAGTIDADLALDGVGDEVFFSGYAAGNAASAAALSPLGARMVATVTQVNDSRVTAAFSQTGDSALGLRGRLDAFGNVATIYSGPEGD